MFQRPAIAKSCQHGIEASAPSIPRRRRTGVIVVCTALLLGACGGGSEAATAPKAEVRASEAAPVIEAVASAAAVVVRAASRGPREPEIRSQPRPTGLAARVLAWRAQLDPTQHFMFDEVVDAAMRGDEKELRQIVQREGERSMWNKTYPTYQAVFNQRDTEGWSALHHAAFNGDTKCLRVLIGTEALSPEVRTAGNPDDIWNPKPASSRDRCVSSLHLAAMEGKIDALRVLVPLKKRAAPKTVQRAIDSATHDPFSADRLAELQPNQHAPWTGIPDIEGLTAFQYAVIFERIEALDHLEEHALETNAPPESYTNRLSSAAVAVDARAIKSLEWLAAHRFPFDEVDVEGHRLLHRAVFTHDPKIVAWLLDKGGFAIDTPTANFRRPTAMHIAAQQGALGVLALLMERGCLAEEWDVYQATPLHYAAATGQVEAAEFLLARGARLHVQATDGSTPLIAAAGGGHTETVRALLELGANASDSDALGNTALMHTAGRGHLVVVNLLLEAGADLNAFNSMGWTALHVAAISGHVAVVERLIDAGAAINAMDGGGATPLDGAAMSANGQSTSRLLRRLGAKLGRELR